MELNNYRYSYFADKKHPNFKRWNRGVCHSRQRGDIVKLILQRHISLEKLSILDIGCGNGITLDILPEDNTKIGCDINRRRLSPGFSEMRGIFLVNCDALHLPFRDGTFDLIILQDSVEHFNNPGGLLRSAAGLLKSGGMLYISTPNKLSLINLLSDPHFGLPLISVMSRRKIKRFILPIFRPEDSNREEIAELLTLSLIRRILSGFHIRLETKFVFNQLLNGHAGIIWSNPHIFLLRIIRWLRVDKIINLILNDRFGFINYFLTSNFYVVAKKYS